MNPTKVDRPVRADEATSDQAAGEIGTRVTRRTDIWLPIAAGRASAIRRGRPPDAESVRGSLVTIPPPDPAALAALAAAVTSGEVTAHFPRCHPCLEGCHFSPPKPHGWADLADIEAAEASGRPVPTGVCGCPCAHGVEVDGWDICDPDVSPDELVESTTKAPCPECDAEGACAWDAEGRPLIHAIGANDE